VWLPGTLLSCDGRNSRIVIPSDQTPLPFGLPCSGCGSDSEVLCPSHQQSKYLAGIRLPVYRDGSVPTRGFHGWPSGLLLSSLLNCVPKSRAAGMELSGQGMSCVLLRFAGIRHLGTIFGFDSCVEGRMPQNAWHALDGNHLGMSISRYGVSLFRSIGPRRACRCQSRPAPQTPGLCRWRLCNRAGAISRLEVPYAPRPQVLPVANAPEVRRYQVQFDQVPWTLSRGRRAECHSRSTYTGREAAPVGRG